MATGTVLTVRLATARDPGAISTYLRKRGLQVITRGQNDTTVYALINRAADAED